MPFEQFMSCLYAVNKEAALQIVRLACNPDESGAFRPNGLHFLVAKLSAAILANRLAKVVTVATTNYDLGLDLSLAEELNQPLESTSTDQAEDCSPAYSLDSDGGRLQYIKIHGCITKPKSLVFTMERLTELTFNPGKLRRRLGSHFGGACFANKILVVSIGYSFSDPDLRPHWLEFFGRNRALVLRLARPKAESKLAEKHRFESVFRGVEFAQEEFFKKLRQREIGCDLFRTEQHFLLELGNALSLNLADFLIPPFTAFPKATVKRSSEIIERLDSQQAAEFLARICDFCTRSDALPLIDDVVFKNPWGNRTVERFYLCFSLRGHRWDMDGQASICRSFRKSFDQSDSKLLGHGLVSFPLTINKPSAAKALRAASRLVLAKWYFDASDVLSQQIFRHYQMHFRLKLRLKFIVWLERIFTVCKWLDQHCNLSSDRGRCERSARNMVWGGLINQLDTLTNEFVNGSSMADITQTADLLVQSQILLGRRTTDLGLPKDRLEVVVGWMESAALAVNKPHNVVWTERTRGWHELSLSEEDDARLKAIIRFCTAILRATYSPHRTKDLLSKTIPQFLRVVRCIDRNDNAEPLLRFDCEPHSISVEELRRACEKIRQRAQSCLTQSKVNDRSAVDWDAAKDIAAFCFELLGKQESTRLRRLLDKWTNPKRIEGNLFALPILPYAGSPDYDLLR
jgi:hypothetical protein